MRHSIQHHLTGIATLSLVLATLSAGSLSRSPGATIYRNWQAQVGSSQAFTVALARQFPDTQVYRTAARLQDRLRRRSSRASAPIDILAEAVAVRQQLLRRNVTVTFATEEDPAHTVWKARIMDHPLWIRSRFTLSEADFFVSVSSIKRTLDEEGILHLPAPVHAALTKVAWRGDGEGISRAEIDNVARGGYIPESDRIAHTVASALTHGDDDLTIVVPKTNGRIINMTGLDLGALELWSTGKSDFRGSPGARVSNIKKALNEHVNNVIVAPGDTFSFNATLGGPVSLGNGWKEAKVIYDGERLEYAPGGGICQASTTVYRSAVNAGLPVEERRAHSLYVSYYKKYGVGIDATIYPGSQDLVFRNDSGNFIVIQAYDNGTEAVVNIYGTPDGRAVALNGPYFAHNAPEGFLYRNRKISSREIVWLNRVEYPSGQVREEMIASRYKELPISVAAEFSPQHAAADETR